MIIGLVSCFIAGMAVFVFYYTKKRILIGTEYAQQKKYSLLTFFLGGVMGEILFLLSYYFYGESLLYCIKLLITYELLLAAAFIDYKLQIIPNFIIVLLLTNGFCFLLLEAFYMQVSPIILIKEYGLGAVFGGGIFLIAKLFVRNGIGMGDIKLFGSLGLLFGLFIGFKLIFFSVLISAIYGVFLLVRKGRGQKIVLPLAPFAYMGIIIIIFLGV